MASTSSATPSQSAPKLNYDVFLSFRGEDIRKAFLDHLNDHLNLKGIFTFKDDNQLKIGDCIAPKLVRAIQESRVAIVIFTENYASSTWCLDEVSSIMECKEKLNQVVVPIFYNVDPSQVRKQTRSFAKSFAKHEENFKDDEGKAKVKRWRKALTEAGSITGHNLHGDKYNGYELDCIKGVVDDIFEQLRPPPSIPKYLVGLESQLEEISTLMEVSKNVKLILGIWGMGGIGKTTVARAAFAKFSSRFDGACFLEDIRGKHSKHGLEALQGKLLSNLLKESWMHIDDVDEGIEMIKKRLESKRVLIVLDGVDQQEQLDKLVGDGEWLCNGSRIIITIRDKHLFTHFGVGVVVKCYEVKKLEQEKALKLFSWHAFKKESPENGFEDLSTSFVTHASGLPLALKVLGSYLCGRTDKKVWESTLEKIKGAQQDEDEKVIERLRISYDVLDENCKKVFLDIACFFRHERRDYIEEVLSSCKLHPAENISVLIDRCILSESNRFINGPFINMHDLIHEMGLNIEREKRSRRWRLDDLDDEPKAVESLLLSFTDPSYDENISPSIEGFKQMTKLKMLIVEYDDRYCSESLDTSWMSIMDYLPRSLMVLKFPYYPSSKPFCTKGLKNLTYLDLRYSGSLLETPNFVEMPNLERLYLSGCKKLKEIHPSAGNLKKLVLLDLSFCSNLEKLPNFNQISSLKSLNLEGCSKQVISEVMNTLS